SRVSRPETGRSRYARERATRPAERLGGDRGRLVLAGREHLVDETVLEGLLGAHDVVAVDVFLDLLDVTAGVVGDRLLEPLAHPEDLARLNLDVGRLPAAGVTGGGLVDDDARVREGEALAGRTRGKQHRG